MKEFLVDLVRNFPQGPGVYFFFIDEDIVYVGKSKNLRSRVLSYFAENQKRRKISAMMKLVTEVSYEECDTHLEALVKEFELIRRLKPLYNSQYKEERCLYFLDISDPKKILSINNQEGLGPFTSRKFLEKFIHDMWRIFPIDVDCENLKLDYRVFPKKLCTEEKDLTLHSLKKIFTRQSTFKKFRRGLEEQMYFYSKSLRFESSFYYKKLLDDLDYVAFVQFEKNNFMDKNFLYEIGDFSYLISRGEIVLKIDGSRDVAIKKSKDFLSQFQAYKNPSVELKNIIYGEGKSDLVRVLEI